MPTTIRQELGNRLLIADGAMGSAIMAAALTSADYQGHAPCPEILNLTRPDLICQIHQSYLQVGVDAIETNSFGANPTALAEHGLADRLPELAGRAAALARQQADQAGRPCWVFGSLGPGTKLPSLGQVSFSVLQQGFTDQATALLNNGADLLLIETCQDLLQAKAAVLGCQAAVNNTGVDAPIIAQITVENTGTMLLGTPTMAAAAALAALGIDGMGLNCATGPDAMGEHLRQLTSLFPLVSVMPNAGLPDIGPNGAVYHLTPEELANALKGFVQNLGVAVVGGCCGTTPAHLAAVVQQLANLPIGESAGRQAAGITSLNNAVPA
ncbi:MAG: homocysteine S-methyltransferase family protein, partial [Bifidobacteriaceae bacterium]|nr:homocysteine S-methyltransferase family protein [Bifidobacteriaceae bacterium]